MKIQFGDIGSGIEIIAIKKIVTSKIITVCRERLFSVALVSQIELVMGKSSEVCNRMT